jgi:GTPase SAR1 family protein
MESEPKQTAKKEINILFIGDSGTGKTTFINALSNSQVDHPIN